MVQYRIGIMDDLDEIYESYAMEFPENERKTKYQLNQLMARGAYHALIAEEVAEDQTIHRIGFACLFVPQNDDFIWLDYLVIERAYQSKGYGSKFFEEMMHMWADRKGMFIEIEIPKGDDINQVRRIAYYEKLGARRLPINYHLPTEVDEMPMYLYFKQAPSIASDIDLSQVYIHDAIISANSTIHWDHANLESVWQKNRFIEL